MTQATEQSVRADGEPEFSCKASTRFTSDGEADQLQRGIQPRCLSGVMSDDGGKSFAEDTVCAEAILTVEAARLQFQLYRYAVPREVSNTAGVAAVDATRIPVTVRTLAARPDRPDDQRDGVSGGAD